MKKNVPMPPPAGPSLSEGEAALEVAPIHGFKFAGRSFSEAEFWDGITFSNLQMGKRAVVRSGSDGKRIGFTSETSRRIKDGTLDYDQSEIRAW